MDVVIHTAMTGGMGFILWQAVIKRPEAMKVGTQALAGLLAILGAGFIKDRTYRRLREMAGNRPPIKVSGRDSRAEKLPLKRKRKKRK